MGWNNTGVSIAMTLTSLVPDDQLTVRLINPGPSRAKVKVSQPYWWLRSEKRVRRPGDGKPTKGFLLGNDFQLVAA